MFSADSINPGINLLNIRKLFENYFLLSSYQKITEHNSQGHSHMLAMNFFGDLTQDEYRFFYLGMRSHFLNETKRSGSTYLEPSHVSLPTEVDWRKEGYVTGVKNQGIYDNTPFSLFSIFPGYSRSLGLL